MATIHHFRERQFKQRAKAKQKGNRKGRKHKTAYPDCGVSGNTRWVTKGMGRVAHSCAPDRWNGGADLPRCNVTGYWRLMQSDKPRLSDSNLTISEIAEIHRKDWQAFRATILLPAANSHDPAEAQFAKLIADAIRISQDSERKAWELMDTDSDRVMRVEWSGEAQCENK